MKRLLLPIILLICVTNIMAEDIQPSAQKKRRPNKIAQAGGLLVAPAKGNKICLVNKQSIVSEGAIRELAKRISQISLVPIQVSDRKLDNSPVTIYFIDSETEPRMLLAPEDGWSKLNLRKILGDSPSQEETENRFKKEFWRVFSYTMGAGNPMMQPSLLRVVKNNADLDMHKQREPWPEALNTIQVSAKAWGLDRARITSYQRACQEGWAPAPTNELQKAVWERVKAEQSAKPTKGIEIKYDPKVGK